MLKLGTKCCISAFKCTRFESNYSSCKGRRSENLCNNSGEFPEFQPPLNANVLFCMFFFNLTLCMTKLREGRVGAFGWNQPNNWKTVLVMLANFHRALKLKTHHLNKVMMWN
jgi:hypothetical protein